MPIIPFTISGIVYDTAGSAVGAGVTVILENATNHETTTGTTNASGQYQIEGANLTSGIVANDIIFLSAVRSNYGQYGEIMGKISSADITTGTWLSANIYLRNGEKAIASGGTKPMFGVMASGYTGTAYTIWLLDRTSAEDIPYTVKAVLTVPANGSTQFQPQAPLIFSGGIRVIQAATAPTKNPNSMTAGVNTAVNVIGDTAQASVMVALVTR